MKMILKSIALFLIVFLCGCETLRMGEIKNVECRVLGLDASIPIPFAQSVNIMNIRIGWVETTYTHGYKTYKYSKVNHDINYLGTSERETYIGESK